MLKILPYKMGSESARELARALGVKRIRREGSYRPKSATYVLNWGSSSAHFTSARMLNQPAAVARATNKHTALQAMKAAGVSVPEFTTSQEEAKRWQRDGYRVVCRHKLNGHSGQGIEVAQPEDMLPYAPLYTRYTKKDREYRIHVFKGRVIDFSEKRKRNGQEVTNSLIRTHSNGWVFCRDGVYLSDSVRRLALQSVQALGLDFGAVDLIMREDKAWVLEVNSAPGLEGTTLRRYIEELEDYV